MTILAEPSATAIPAGTWTIDPAHSTVEFVLRFMGLATLRGRAPVVKGAIRGGSDPAVEGAVDATTLVTFDESRDEHLRSPEFFDTARHPELRFASTSVTTDGAELRVDGELTIKGVTKPVELVGTLVGAGSDPWGNERVGIDLTGTVDRRDFGLTWNAPLPGGGFLLPDTVAVTASLSAIKTAE